MNLKQISHFANTNKIPMTCFFDLLNPNEFKIGVFENDVQEIKEYFSFRGPVGIRFIIQPVPESFRNDPCGIKDMISW